MGGWWGEKGEREEVVVHSVVLPLRITTIGAATGPCAPSLAELYPCLVVKKKAHLISQLGFLSVVNPIS